jgi:rhodanese-related sulfurtransferase
MPAQRIDISQARVALQQEQGSVYLDVRTEEEFAAGHPEGAINIPIGTPNPMRQRLDPNPDFLAVARASLSPDTPVIIGCRSGPRAEMAANLLVENGYANVRWALGGFLGMVDQAGSVLAPGWRHLGLPESRETGEGVGYRSLRRKALGGA